MADFIKAISLADVSPGSMKQVVVGGKSVAITNIDGVVFAVADSCTHKECSLGNEGFLNGKVITCGCHGAQFDAATGKVMSLPATVDLATYETKVENGEIYVKL